MTPLEEIMNVVSIASNIPVSDIMGKRRFRSFALARHMVWYLAYLSTGMTLKEIGKKTVVYKADWTTVIHGRENIVKFLRNSDKLTIKLAREILKINPNYTKHLPNVFQVYDGMTCPQCIGISVVKLQEN